MTGTGLGFPATRLALGRLAHLRAILAARLWTAANPAWAQGQAWWQSERRLRADQPAAGRKGHIPAAAVIAAWPVTLVAGAGYLAAWLRGWPPRPGSTGSPRGRW